MSEQKNRSRGIIAKIKKTGRMLAFFLFVALLAGVAAYGADATFTDGRIAQGVSILDIDVGGRSKDEAMKLLRDRVTGLVITFEADTARTTLVPTTERGKNDPIALFEADAAIDSALSVGRRGHPLLRASSRVKSLLAGTSIPLPYRLDRKALESELRAAFASKVRPARDARLLVRLDRSSGDVLSSVLPEEEGETFDVDNAVAETEERLRSFSVDPVVVPVKKDFPELTVNQVEPVLKLVPAALAHAPFAMTANGKRWTVTKGLLADWLSAAPSANAAELGLDRDKVTTYLKTIAPDLEAEPKNAVFEMKDGKVVAFEPSVDGSALDIDAAFETIKTAVLNAGIDTLDLPIAIVKPEITTESSNPYGIREVIGIGDSNFRGSPANRKVNIRVGAKSLDGIIVPAGEEFSLLKALGDIDGAHGYLQELVIKGDKTTPEFGGGLCQIGSTTFRAVLASGLPVTERRNHSYRVPYYERAGDGSYIGPGKDATIYDPAPDFKFLNDTGAAVMIRTEIEGNTLRFVFWGVNDGRKAEQTAARVWNIIPPPEKKLIETTELKPGETKCTERPHEGADAMFTYTVTYPGGEVKTKDFFSRYRPWGEVCLVGVDPSKASSDAAATTDGLPSADASGATGR
ncbi:VanW family protein [Candidatus Uhrbacteria bacterium]|nr:VanW family protein [Candidatus Uhrbacteria bacterium]